VGGLRCRGCLEGAGRGWLAGLVWLHRPPTPTRNPPCRARRFAWAWRRRWRRASPFGLALPRMSCGRTLVAPICALGATTLTSPGRSMSAGGSASPQGEARREAPPRRSIANAAAGRITGGGGRGGVSQAVPGKPFSNPATPHPRQRARLNQNQTHSDSRPGPDTHAAD